MERAGVKMLLFSEDDMESIHGGTQPRLCAGAHRVWGVLAVCERARQAGLRGAIWGDSPASFQTMTRMQ